jgi:hypothetical protein
MNVPRSVGDVLDGHVVLEVERIERMCCNVYVPGAAVRGWSGLVS